MKKWAIIGAMSLAVAACAAQRSPNGPDFGRGVWGMQAIKPPAGLLTAQQGDLINRMVADPYGPGPLAVKYTLVDPSTGDARYAVIASPLEADSYIPVPVSALTLGPGSATMTATGDELNNLPHYSLGRLQSDYPRTVLTPMASGAEGAASASSPASNPTQPATTTTSVSPYATTTLPPPPGTSAATTAPPSMGGGTVQMVRSGSYVGDPVLDTSGRTIGTVNAVAVTPGSNQIRYVVVSTQSYGTGSFIIVPASSASFAGDRIYLTGAAQPQ